MSWTWSYHGDDGADATGADGGPPPVAPDFPNQSDAESWLGESWRELAAGGVDSVSLLDGERVVYGPMSLNPAD